MTSRIEPATSVKIGNDKRNGDGVEADNGKATAEKSLCWRCKITGRVAKFRPLVGDSGDFICDQCYRALFPATAMVDDGADASAAGKVRRGVARVNRGIGNAVTSAAATMGVEDWNECAEEEECRMCLEPGTMRPCCRNYYCHPCYFRAKACPGCGAEVHLTGIGQKRNGSGEEDPGRVAVGLSWALSIATVATSIAIAAAVVWNDWTSPVTVWGHRCHGWFPSCDIEACVDTGDATPEKGGSSSEFLGMPWAYRRCTLARTVDKVVGKACLFDGQLYDRTGGALGYDFCLSAPREAQKGMDGGSGVSFQEGGYIFEDDFDRWSASSNDGILSSNSSNKNDDSILDPTGSFRIGMASAIWSDMTNADVSDACGVHSTVNNSTRPYLFADENRNGSAGALVFSGVHFRYATTARLNVEHGGHVEFHLKFAPITPNEKEARCKTAYGGDAVLSYSTDEGMSWNRFGTYPVYLYRNPSFTAVKESIPRGAWGNRTQFRWSQPTFEPLRDWWAIDDVRIFRNFGDNWKSSENYEVDKRERMEYFRNAQCIVDSEMCELFPNDQFLGFDANDEPARSFLGFEGQRKFRFKSFEIFVLGSLLVTLGRLSYDALAKTIQSPKHKFQHLPTRLDTSRVVSEDETVSPFVRQRFYHEVHKSWQAFNAILLMGPVFFVMWRQILTYIVAASEGRGPGLFNVLLSLVALVLDAYSLVHLMREVFRVSYKCRKAKFAAMPDSRSDFGDRESLLEVLNNSVEVDTDPNQSYLRVGSRFIPLSDVVDIVPSAATYCFAVHFCFFLGGLPYNSACIVLRSYLGSEGWSYDVVRAATRIIGTIAVARSLTGRPTMFVRAFFGLEWLFSGSIDRRDDMGRALKRRGVVETMWYTTGIAVILTSLLVAVSGDGIKRGKGILTGGGTLLGALLGVLMGTMRGLPVDPHVHLTRWPTRGYCVVYNDRVRCPCLFNFAYCTDMHSRRRLLILYLDDMLSFRSMLKGVDKGLALGATTAESKNDRDEGVEK